MKEYITARKIGVLGWIYTTVILILSFTYVNGQGNLKAGYIGSYYTYDLLDHTIDVFNAELPSTYGDNLNALNIANGLEFGYRYKFGDAAFDFSYSLAFAGTSVQVGEDEDTSYKMRYRHHAIHTGFESYLGRLGIGAAAQYNFLRMTGERGTMGFNLLDNTKYFNLKLYLNYQAGGNDNSALSIQPYIDVPLASDHSLSGVAEFLEVADQGSGKISYTLGLRLIIYNGAQ